jgi:cyclic dehypoxanthinyl futalosine synthase
MGMGVAQMALLGGADDAGSTMMEENVVSASGTTKFSASEQELQTSIIRSGYIPLRRDSDYNHLETPDTTTSLPDAMCLPPSQFVELV